MSDGETSISMSLQDLIEKHYEKRGMQIPQWSLHQIDALEASQELIDNAMWMLCESKILIDIDYE
jgi:hypothetical protein